MWLRRFQAASIHTSIEERRLMVLFTNRKEVDLLFWWTESEEVAWMGEWSTRGIYVSVFESYI